MNMVDLDAPVSQRQFAMILGCSREAISQAAKDGVLREGASLGEWLQAMHKHRTETAAGRRGGPLDLCQERARLAKLQADRILLDLKKERQEVMHLEPIGLLVGASYSNARTKILSLPNRIKSLVSYILPRDVDAIDDACREILTDIASTQLPPEISSRIDALEQAAWLQIGVDLKTHQYGKQNGQARTRPSAENARDRKKRAAHMAPDTERRQAAEEA